MVAAMAALIHAVSRWDNISPGEWIGGLLMTWPFIYMLVRTSMRNKLTGRRWWQ